ncbi:MAG: polysaccharide biosynthesis tyrosine autokinase [Hyphomicrobiales bacterium]
MTLRDFLRLARRWWLAVLVACSLAGGAAYLVSRQMDPVYRAQATLLVNQAQNPAALTYQDILGSQQLTTTYAELATSNINLQRAVEQLQSEGVDVSTLQKRVEAKPIKGTQLIRISAEDTDPKRAAEFANTVSEVFLGYIKDAQLAGNTDPGTHPLNTVFVAGSATPPASPVSPNIPLNVAVGVFVGLVLMVGGIAVIEYMNDRVNAREDLDSLGLAYLGGVIQTSRPRRDKSWIARPGSNATLLESFRQVQANLAFALSTTPAKVILISSSQPSEGKSTVASNLAAALAESSKRVLLIDGDFRKPDAHRYFGFPNTIGLTSTVAAGPETATSFARPVSEFLSVLGAGPVPPNPTEMISSPRMAEAMAALRNEYDIIIIDSPPLLGIADSALWTNLSDAVVLVARRKKTRSGQLEESVRLVRASHKPLLGVIINGYSPHRMGYYYYRPREESQNSKSSVHANAASKKLPVASKE